MSRAAEITKWYDSLKNRRANADTTAEEVRDYIMPHAGDGTNTRAPGEKKNSKIFDSTAGYGAHVFAQFVQSSVINPAQKWMDLTHKDPKVNESQKVSTWFTGTRDKMLNLMRTSFYGPAGQGINSWTGFGNGPLLIEEVPQKREGLNRIRYTSVPWGGYVMAEGDDGKVDQFIRTLSLPAHQIVRMDGITNLSNDIQRAAEKEPLKEFEILHACIPREMQFAKTKLKTAKDMPWASMWIEKEKQVLIKESGYRKFPYAIARYDLLSGETYARGPSELALPDAKTLNQADAKALLKWDRELDPPTLTRQHSIVSRLLDKRAGGDTIVRDINNSTKPMFEGSNWQAHDLMAQRKEQAILRVYHVNEILNLLAREKPEMTAFEVNARLTLLQQILGPVFGRLESDFLSVIVDVTLDIMAYAGMLEQPPDEIMQGDDWAGLINVTYEGPLARAQRNGEILALQQSLADVAGIQPFYPEVTMLPDWEKATRKLFEIRGTQDLLVSDDDFTNAVNESRKKADADKLAGLVAGGAEALGKAAPGLKVLRDEASGRAAA